MRAKSLVQRVDGWGLWGMVVSFLMVVVVVVVRVVVIMTVVMVM
jgi:hypothetical protein